MVASISIPILAVVGSQGSGKTATVEAMVNGLTRKGYRLATAKHIHGTDFTIDTKNKDTWRHAQAGARVILSVAEKELTIIKKENTANYTLTDITGNCEDNTDLIIVEGFRKLVAQDLTVPKIVAVKNKDEITEAIQIFKPILAFTGSLSKAETPELKIPYLDLKKEPEKLIGIIEKRVAPIIQKRRESKETVSININGKQLPLNPYVQKITRNVLFGVISTLKGAAIKGDEDILIKINKVPKE
jgi:molybdopterin-guanine dinucleotide biosynthesis protein MobB